LTSLLKNYKFRNICWQIYEKTENNEKPTHKFLKKYKKDAIHADEFSKKLKITKKVSSNFRGNRKFRKIC